MGEIQILLVDYYRNQCFYICFNWKFREESNDVHSFEIDQEWQKLCKREKIELSKFSIFGGFLLKHIELSWVKVTLEKNLLFLGYQMVPWKLSKLLCTKFPVYDKVDTFCTYGI